MHGPDGTTYPNRIEWREIVSPERLVFWHGSFENDPDHFMTTVTFAERDGGTEITLRALFGTRERRDHVVEHYHAVEGGRETLERLDGYVAEFNSGGGCCTSTPHIAEDLFSAPSAFSA